MSQGSIKLIIKDQIVQIDGFQNTHKMIKTKKK